MVKRYLLVCIGVVFFGMSSVLFGADTEITLEDSTTASGFSVKDSSGETLMRVRGDGNVGIGTAEPEFKLDVAGTIRVQGIEGLTNQPVQFTDIDVSNGLKVGIDSIRIGSGRRGAANTITFDSANPGSDRGIIETSPNSAMPLEINAGSTGDIFLNGTSTGNVGIGTRAPSEKLSVAGTIESMNGGFKFPDGTTQDTAASGGFDIGSCQFCFKVFADGDAGQCGGSPGNIPIGGGVTCVPIDQWSQSYRDDTDNRGGGCVMSWKIDCTSPFGD